MRLQQRRSFVAAPGAERAAPALLPSAIVLLATASLCLRSHSGEKKESMNCKGGGHGRPGGSRGVASSSISPAPAVHACAAGLSAHI